MSTALTLLADEEVRVRQAAGELLGAFCQKFGPRVYEECQAHVFELIKTNLDRSDVTEQNQQQEKVSTDDRSDVNNLFYFSKIKPRLRLVIIHGYEVTLLKEDIL